MGNSCAASGSVAIANPDVGSSQNEKDGAVARTVDKTSKTANRNNNNDNNNDNNNAKGSEKCADYVRKALDAQKVVAEEVADFSECLLELAIEHELVFDFSSVEINQPDIKDDDEPDVGDGDQASSDNDCTRAIPALTHESSSASVSDVGATVPHSESEEEIDISTRETKWPKCRKKKFEYALPTDKYSCVYEDKFDVRGTEKRKIIALSDLHLGGDWSKGMDWKLEQYLDGIIETAKEQVACMVLLGDVFEMWLEKFAEIPPSNAERVEAWKEAATVLTTAVSKLVNECAVKVYYVRGNHDHEITEQDVAAVFDVPITFVPCTLILRIQTSDNDEQRVRLAHGHEWDVFNSYMLHQTNNLLPDRPIGYYIARAVATAGRGDTQSEVEDLLIGLATTLLSVIPAALEDDLVDSLVEPTQHRRLLSRLFEGAFQVKDLDFMIHAKCRLSEDKWIRLDTMLDYPLMRLCGSLVGKQDVFHMIKASTGDYKKFIKRSDEDVIVLAHTHRWDLRKYKNRKGNQVIYANTGCWTSNSEEFSTVILNPPTGDEDGSVLIDYGKNEDPKD